MFLLFREKGPSGRLIFGEAYQTRPAFNSPLSASEYFKYNKILFCSQGLLPFHQKNAKMEDVNDFL
jgi:hypothetical protein